MIFPTTETRCNLRNHMNYKYICGIGLFLLLSLSCGRKRTVSFYEMERNQALFSSKELESKEYDINPKYYLVVSTENGLTNPGNSWDIMLKIIQYPESNTFTVLLSEANFFACNWSPGHTRAREDFASRLPIIADGRPFKVEVSGLTRAFSRIVSIHLMETTL